MSLDYDVALEDQLRECYGRVVYTHKTHEQMADQNEKKFKWIRITQISLSALTSAGLVGIIFVGEKWLEIGTAAISFLMLFFSTYLKSFDLGGAVQKHREAAAKLWNVRECYLSLITDLPSITREAAVDRRDELQAMLAALYVGAPQTDAKAYKKAQDRLQKKEDMTFTEDEIDCFLPLSLKRSGGRTK